MMGRQGEAARLFYDFCLDDHVPLDHLLRRIDAAGRPEQLLPLGKVENNTDGQWQQATVRRRRTACGT